MIYNEYSSNSGTKNNLYKILLFFFQTVHDEKQTGGMSQEQHELLMKDRDRDSGATPGCRSDSDNRSHVSALSSQPSHSSHSASHSASHTQSQNLSQQSGRSAGKTSLDRLYFPRHELQTLGILGMNMWKSWLLLV